MLTTSGRILSQVKAPAQDDTARLSAICASTENCGPTQIAELTFKILVRGLLYLATFFRQAFEMNTPRFITPLSFFCAGRTGNEWPLNKRNL